MINFLKKLLIAEFDWTWKERLSFLGYQIVLIIVIWIFIGILFSVEFIFEFLEIDFCYKKANYCNENEVFIWKIIQISENILFLMILLFSLKFNSGLIERFSFFRFTWILEKIFLVVLTLLKLSIIWIFIFLLCNFILFLGGNEIFFIHDILNFSWKTVAKEISFILEIIIYFELFLFLLWLLLSRKK